VIDGLRGIQAIAEQHKDQATVDKAQHAFRDILSFRASWLFKSVSIRSKGKDTEENGVDFFARLQRIHSAETSRVLSVYPY
jgi:hypothetical protein